MKNDREQAEYEILRAYLRNQVKKYDQYFSLPVHFYKLSAGQDFAPGHDSCDGFCPECERILQCETYKETKDAWDRYCS